MAVVSWYAKSAHMPPALPFPVLPPSGSISSYVGEVLVGEQLVKAAPITATEKAGQILIFRGLRVRMGMATGAEVGRGVGGGRSSHGPRLCTATCMCVDFTLCAVVWYSMHVLEILRIACMKLIGRTSLCCTSPSPGRRC
jgi:hypothetical protein